MAVFAELKRRNVIRIALLYCVASWLIIQVVDVGMSLLDLPDWTGRFVFLLLLVGFPLVLVFSWVYEITPEGLKREKDIDRSASVTAETAKKLNIAVIALLTIAVALLAVDRFIPGTPDETTPVVPATAAAPEQSIAVLPFVNMSADAENEYFSDGLSEELLNLLARIPELRVAARTSSFTFKDSDADIREIADSLNVAHLLEGSVRKSGNRIRVTAQLINAADGYHLWSETWDRELDDVFAIQDDIAAAVVDGLSVELLGELPHAQVTDPRAYDLFLKAQAAVHEGTGASYSRALELLDQALAIDPDYADAWAQIGSIQSNRVGLQVVDAELGFSLAREAAEKALEIEPDHGSALSMLGWIAMYWDWDMDEAARLMRRAIREDPGNVTALNSFANLNGAMGRNDELVEYLGAALERDPLAVSALANLSVAYANRREFAKSERLLRRLRDVAGESVWTRMYSGWIAWVQGQPEQALAQFEGLDGYVGRWGEALCFYDLGLQEEAVRALEELKAFTGSETAVAMTYVHMGDLDTAFEWLDRAYEERDPSLVEMRMYLPFTGTLEGDPRWTDFLRKLGTSDADADRLGL